MPVMNRKIDPIDAEAFLTRQQILAGIRNMTAKEKDAYYQAIADAIKKVFKPAVNGLKSSRPAEKRAIRDTKSGF